MPKDWETHREEIERLYMEDNLTLKEVRRVLSERGFDASTRAYQMRLDQWKLYKYGQNRDSRAHKRTAPSPEVDPDSSEDTLDDSTQDVTNQEIEDFDIKTTSPRNLPELMIKVILQKWRSDGQYLEHALSMLQSLPYGIEIAAPASSTPTIFRLIDEEFPTNARFILTKGFLEADLTAPMVDLYPSVMWKNSWRAASNAKSWENVKDLLYEGCQKPQQLGAVFMDAALVVLAERMLKQYMTRLEHLRARQAPLAASEMDEAAELRAKYMAILKDFYQSKLDLGTQCYKYSLTIVEWDIATTRDPIANKDNDATMECNENLLRLKDFCSSFEGGVDHVIENLILTVNVLKNTKKFVQPQASFGHHDPNDLHLSFVGRMALDDISEDSSPVLDRTASVLQSLFDKYTAEALFQQDISSILQEDGEEFSLFQESRKGRQNLFDLIPKTVPASQVNPFMRVILSLLGNDFSRSPAFEWWRSVLFCSRWTHMETLIQPDEVLLHLGTIMLPDTVKMLLDTTILLSGERLLAVLGREMDREQENISVFDHSLAKHAELRREYLEILKTFRQRKLKTDQSFFEYLLFDNVG